MVVIDSLSYLRNLRVTQWSYPADITAEQAETEAKLFAEAGINLILTEDHRYIMYDWQDESNPPTHCLFKAQNKEKSINATKTVVDACHKYGIKVFHHVTASYCSDDYIQQHPDWSEKDLRTGKTVFFDQYGGVNLLCINNLEFRTEYFKTVVEISKKTGVDGWMIDEIEWLPDWFSCGCPHCREKFSRETGLILPSGEKSEVWENFEHPIWREWIKFRMRSCGDFFVDLKNMLAKEVPGQCLTACDAGISGTHMTLWWGADGIDYSRGIQLMFYEVWLGKGADFHNWRRIIPEMKLYSAVARKNGYAPLTLFYPRSEKEIRFCWSLAMLQGHRLWANAWFKNVYPKFFQWEKQHEFLFCSLQKPITDIALLFSKQTRDGYKGRDDNFYVNEWAGWGETLTESNISYEVILDEDIVSDYLKKFKVLILPNAACLSDNQIESITEFSNSAGKVVATADTATRNESGGLRPDRKPVTDLWRNCKYFPDLIAEKYFIGTILPETEFQDNRDSRTKEEMLNSIQSDKGFSWKVDAPNGVIVNVFKQDNHQMIIHILNATGSILESGNILPKDTYPVEFPVVKDIMIELNSALILPDKVVAYSPDRPEPLSLETMSLNNRLTIKIPELKEYSILQIIPKK